MKDTCIFTFGRMNPPHIGHGEVFNKALELHKSTKNSSLKVYISKSSYSNKNPLPYDLKVKYIKELFPDVSTKIQKVYSNIDLFGIMEILNGSYRNIIFVGGSDRIDDFQKKLDTYNGVLYNFDSISTVQAGIERSDFNYSSSLMRQAVEEDDFKTFCDSIPGNDLELKERLYKDVQFYMMGKVNEQYTEVIQFKNEQITLG